MDAPVTLNTGGDAMIEAGEGDAHLPQGGMDAAAPALDAALVDALSVVDAPPPFSCGFPKDPPSQCGKAGAPACATFSNMTATSGLPAAIPPSVWDTSGSAILGDVVAMGHLDDDALPDLVRTGGDGVHVFRNTGASTFVEVTTDWGLTGAPAHRSALVGDVDGDGKNDLVLVADGSAGVYRRNGDVFSSIAGAIPALNLDWATCSALGDYDRDGDLDLAIARDRLRERPVFLLQNDGSGRFADVTYSAGLPNTGTYAFQPVFIDYDDDGDVDLFVANDRGPQTGISSKLFRNDGGQFVDVTAGAGLTLLIDGMGVAPGDLDGDLDLDLYVTNLPNANGAYGNALFLNDGDGTFTEGAPGLGLQLSHVGWGTLMLDFDNDGDLDLLAIGDAGYIMPGTRLYENLGGSFRDVTVEVGLTNDQLDSYGVAVGDLDADGFVDITVANWKNAPSVLVYRNAGNANHWLDLRLHGSGGNSFAIGAKVTATIGAQTIVRHVDAGSGFGGSSPPEVILGLAGAQGVDRVVVRWPSGVATTHDCLTADQVVDVFEEPVAPQGDP